MATAKKTTTARKTTTTRKTTVKKTAEKAPEIHELKRDSDAVHNETGNDMSVFEKMAVMFAQEVTAADVDLGNGITVRVRHRIGLGEMMMAVRHIVDTCTDEEHGEVNFELFEYVLRAVVCSVYCNESLPANNEITYLATVGRNHLFDRIVEHIDHEQFDTIRSAAHQRLEAKSEMFTGAAAKVTVDMLQRINELYDILKSTTEDFSGSQAADALLKLSALVDGK